MITAGELKNAIQQKNMNISTVELQNIIDEVDYAANNKINYTEFLAATMDLHQFLDEHKLLAVFRQFDTDNSGQITEENIYYAM